jgi:uncharacterized 2Fe-2S/4Fe-4S cluster protein (DUF4445 family)
MKQLKLLPSGKTIRVQSGTIILDALRQNGIEISAPCNGQGICGKCKVRIINAQPPIAPQQNLNHSEIQEGVRLACREVVEDDMQITLPEGHTLDSRILEGERISKIRVAPAAKVREVNRIFHLYYRGCEPVMLNGCWQSGYSPKGLAVDLGTTTMVVTLMDLQTGAELSTFSSINPQTRYGHDVMTRIQEASTQEGLRRLATLVSDGLNELIDRACVASGSHPHEILDVVLGGNTTMLQIAAAIDPSPLGVVPFPIGIKSGVTYPSNQFRLNINPYARVYIPPVTHAFVGSDISAGLLSVRAFDSQRSTLFIDLGTNGEMALMANGHFIVTSTAAGPAFEGMGISQGMRASSGAIEMVWSNGNFLTVRTIDDAPAKGICGSGIMDVMACLIEQNAVDASGLLKNPQSNGHHKSILLEQYEIFDQVGAIRLTEQVYFTQKDVRQFQLAKSAIKTGIDMLLSAARVQANQLFRIIVAGAFGYHLKIKSLKETGIVPRNFEGELDFVGNTCRTGCALMLLDAETRDYLESKMKSVPHLSIAEQPDFQSRFIDNIALY